MDTRTRTAAEALRSLLAIPDDRPGAWEADHIIALENELRAVLAILTEGSDDQTN